MDAVLLHTDVFSYLLKRGDTRAESYRRHVKNKTIAVSFVTVGKLYAWAETRQWSAAHCADLETRLRSVLVVPYDLDVCRAYGRLVSLETSEGTARNLAANDRWIVACALRHGLVLVSNNRRHFEGIPDLKLISEAPAPRRPRSQRLPLSEESQ